MWSEERQRAGAVSGHPHTLATGARTDVVVVLVAAVAFCENKEIVSERMEWLGGHFERPG